MTRLTQLVQAPRFHQLGDKFFSLVSPQGLPGAKLVCASSKTAELLGIEQADLLSDEFLQLASGNAKFSNSEPLAMVYSGHQFGVYVPQLGDGRALILADINGVNDHWELQLKGAGKTPYSRFGDGRAVLRSTIREYLCSEAMAGLGIPTTRALSITTGELPVQRETVEPGAILIRLARSHVRFGSFEYFHYTGQYDQVKELANFVIEHYHPDLAGKENCYSEFLRRVVIATAELIANWQSVGFAHGVMNTDNMSILGDTLDYGPFGFLDTYQPNHICNHSDDRGRYSFRNQPAIGLWNCNALAHALSSLIESEQLKNALQAYEPHFLNTLAELMSAKLGLTEMQPNDGQLIDDLLGIMAKNSVDYTVFFRRLCDFKSNTKNPMIEELFNNPADFSTWGIQYEKRLKTETKTPEERTTQMKMVNPKFVLRNYMAESAIRKAEDQADYSEIERLTKLLASPFDEHPDMEHYAGLPPEWSQEIAVSCSS